MLKTSTFFLSLLLGVLMLLPACSSDDMGPSNDEELAFQKELQAILETKVGTDKLVGVSVSIRVAGQERWLLTGGLSKEGQAMEPSMRFGIASITKTVVAATIMKLEEDNLLDLQDPISKWLDLNSPNVDEAITVFQLLNHQTGLKGYFHHPDIWPRVENNLNTAIAPIELVDYIGEPLFAPGERYEYSNSNYLILGLLIEAVTQKTVGQVMREKLWTPLNLNAVYFGANEPVNGTLATPWRDGDGDGSLEDISSEYQDAYHSVFYTAADVFASASDLSKWAEELFEGNAVSHDSRQKMLNFLDLPDPIANGYGLGIRRVLLAGRNTWGHTGGMRGYGSYMFYEPNSRVSIVLLNNQSRSANGPLLRYELVNELLLQVYAKVSSEALEL